MNKMNLKRVLTWILCVVLIAAAALMTTGCSKKDDRKAENAVVIPVTDGAVLGKGETQFAFVIADKEGKETSVTVNTDKTVVGDALIDLGLIEGEAGQYGLYVKKVNGITADYDVDGTYWAFYVDGAYAMTGVDSTDIVPGSTYMFKVEK